MHATVLVIGAGVSGLTTAVCLAEEGWPVRVRTRHPPSATTSCAAGAIWGPYLVDDDRVARWSETTRSVLATLAADEGTGIRLRYGLEAARAATTPPGWATELAGFRECHRAELPDGFVSGWWYTAPIVDMPTYLAYLVRRLGAAGGKIEVDPVGSLEEALAAAPVAVNCSGIGARSLVPDPTVTPTRGQIVVVDNPGIDTFFVEHDESPAPTYFLPHGECMVLGGSAEAGRDDLAPDLPLAVAIQRRCALVEPLLGDARLRGHRVGVRPSRPRVRLEYVRLGQRHLIHNYGHGGSGLTLSWGCAREVVGLLGRL